jgi:Putative zinc-finger
MKCNQAEELLPLYTKNALDSQAAESLAAHMRSCASCTRVAEEYEAVSRMLDLYQPPEFGEMLHEEIRRNVLGEIKKQRARPTLLLGIADLLIRPNFLALISGLVLLVFGIVGFLSLNDSMKDTFPLAKLDDNGIVTKQSPPLLAPPDETNSPNPEPLTTQENKINKTEVGNTLRRRVRAGNSAINNSSRAAQTRSGRKKTESLANYRLIAKSENPPDENQPGGLRNASTLASLPARPVLRMEMQTSNPNIRIIMFSQK